MFQSGYPPLSYPQLRGFTYQGYIRHRRRHCRQRQSTQATKAPGRPKCPCGARQSTRAAHRSPPRANAHTRHTRDTRVRCIGGISGVRKTPRLRIRERGKSGLKNQKLPLFDELRRWHLFSQIALEKVFFIRTNAIAVSHQIRLVFDVSLPKKDAIFRLPTKKSKK